jgi:hypothetical protein
MSLLVAAAFFSCEKAPAVPVAAGEAPLPADWTTHSKLGNAVVTGGRRGEACRVTCEVAGRGVWKRDECLAKPADHRFVSDDCATLVVLQDAPFIDKVLNQTQVGVTLGATGTPVALRLGRMAKNPTTKLSESGRWVAWLRGTLGSPGSPPRDLADGSGLAFETLDGVTRSLSFAELAHWVDLQPAPSVVVGADGSGALYTWADGSGGMQVGPYSQIPANQRAKATRVPDDSLMFVTTRAGPSPELDRCIAAQEKLDRVTAEQAALKAKSPDCDKLLAAHEMVSWTRCALAEKLSAEDREEERAAMQKKFESATEELRRLRGAGCR